MSKSDALWKQSMVMIAENLNSPNAEPKGYIQATIRFLQRNFKLKKRIFNLAIPKETRLPATDQKDIYLNISIFSSCHPHDIFRSSIQKTVLDLKAHKCSGSWYNPGGTWAHVLGHSACFPCAVFTLRCLTRSHFSVLHLIEHYWEGPLVWASK